MNYLIFFLTSVLGIICFETVSSQNIYQYGQCEGNCYDGKGNFRSNNSVRYEGTWLLGRPHGDGKMILPDGGVIEGFWMNGILDGIDGKKMLLDANYYKELARNMGMIPDFAKLAQRFRPYLKFSNDGGEEIFKPCSWQYFYKNSYLTKGNITILNSNQLSHNYLSILDHADIRNWSLNNAIDYELIPSESAIYGENWENVAEKGNGLYCHVEQIKDHIYSIEYWILYGINKNSTIGEIAGFGHLGDLTSVQLTYDKRADKIINVAFNIHGSVIEQFFFSSMDTKSSIDLLGKNIYDNRVVSEKCLEYSVFKSDHSGPGNLGLVIPQYQQSSNRVYFAYDPLTNRPEHIVLFNEWGTHEPWPNPDGGFIGVPKHRGDSFSFLPDSVHLLSSNDDPFVYYGGKIGNDPTGIMLHKFWYLKNNIYNIPLDKRTDKNPYQYLENVRIEYSINVTRINSSIEFNIESDKKGEQAIRIERVGTFSDILDMGGANQNIWFWWNKIDGAASLTIKIHYMGESIVVFDGDFSYSGSHRHSILLSGNNQIRKIRIQRTNETKDNPYLQASKDSKNTTHLKFRLLDSGQSEGPKPYDKERIITPPPEVVDVPKSPPQQKRNIIEKLDKQLPPKVTIQSLPPVTNPYGGQVGNERPSKPTTCGHKRGTLTESENGSCQFKYCEVQSPPNCGYCLQNYQKSFGVNIPLGDVLTGNLILSYIGIAEKKKHDSEAPNNLIPFSLENSIQSWMASETDESAEYNFKFIVPGKSYTWLATSSGSPRPILSLDSWLFQSTGNDDLDDKKKSFLYNIAAVAAQDPGFEMIDKPTPNNLRAVIAGNYQGRYPYLIGISEIGYFTPVNLTGDVDASRRLIQLSKRGNTLLPPLGDIIKDWYLTGIERAVVACVEGGSPKKYRNPDEAWESGVGEFSGNYSPNLTFILSDGKIVGKGFGEIDAPEFYKVRDLNNSYLAMLFVTDPYCLVLKREGRKIALLTGNPDDLYILEVPQDGGTKPETRAVLSRESKKEVYLRYMVQNKRIHPNLEHYF